MKPRKRAITRAAMLVAFAVLMLCVIPTPHISNWNQFDTNKSTTTLREGLPISASKASATVHSITFHSVYTGAAALTVLAFTISATLQEGQIRTISPLAVSSDVALPRVFHLVPLFSTIVLHMGVCTDVD